MYGLPKSTEVRRPLPKAQLYKKFELKPSQRDAIDADIARMDFVNMIAPQTLPAISDGQVVKSIFVVDVELKRHDYDSKSLLLIAKLIPQQIVFALRNNDKVQFALFHTQLFISPWQSIDSASLPLNGLNFDNVWQNLVTAIGDFTVANGTTLSEQIKIEEERSRLNRQIAALEKQMNSTKQPRRKRELFLEIQKLRQAH